MGMETGKIAPLLLLPGIDGVMERISHCFARTEVKLNARLYLKSLLDHVDRKNCWQLAEAAGRDNPYGLQRLLCKARWDADRVRDDLRDYVLQLLNGKGSVWERGLKDRGFTIGPG